MAHPNSRQNQLSVTPTTNVPQAVSNQVWRYSNINNVKVVYNSTDAQNYLRTVASGWGIDESSPVGRQFLDNVLKATEQHRPAPKHPSIFEYPMETPYETHYMLILIHAKKDRIEIGYSYHYMTNNASTKSSDPVISQRYSIESLREKARQSMQLPAAIVSSMVNNDALPVQDVIQPDRQHQLTPSLMPTAMFANPLHNDNERDDISRPISSNDPVLYMPQSNLVTTRQQYK